ncbi:hypothetical protein JB92DRAFT_2661839, partial [Gautieria morchelliformis]
GRIVRTRAVIDGGAMRNTICSSKWREWEHRLGPKTESDTTLRVADNHRIKSKGRWKGEVTVAEVPREQSFEIFESNGSFDIILGKPWLQAVEAIHEYGPDQITIGNRDKTATITN